MLNKVISGGQTGADIAGLKAAKDAGFRTGGYINKGFKTLDGNKPEYGKIYDLEEIKSLNYPVRTKANVINSDATVIFATKLQSRGVALTIRLANEAKKPIFIADMSKMNTDDMIQWIKQHNVRTLNVAGNSENKSPGIEETTYAFLNSVLNKLMALNPLGEIK